MSELDDLRAERDVLERCVTRIASTLEKFPMGVAQECLGAISAMRQQKVEPTPPASDALVNANEQTSLQLLGEIRDFVSAIAYSMDFFEARKRNE